MIKIKLTVPYKSNFFPMSDKITEIFIRKEDSWKIIDSIRTEYCDFKEIFLTLLDSIEKLDQKWVFYFLTTYWKNKRVKEWDVVKFYFIMDGEPWYDNDEYEFIFEDTFESLKKAIKSFEKEGKQYLD